MQPDLKYQDPHPTDRGLLLSDRIEELCKAELLIKSGYDRKHLRPASYTLTIGDDFIDSDGRRRRLTKDRDSFIFKKNSVVYVSTAEDLDLPYWVVARFNLRVKWVYDGILLGTGPQVDPGFCGRLSCPLYNLTSSNITIRRGQEFATIDFEKTTSFLGTALTAREKKAHVDASAAKGFVELENRRYLLFPQRPLEALEHHPNQVLISSLTEMRNEVRTWRNIGLGLVIAFIALTLSLLGFGVNIYRQEVENLKEVEGNKTDIARLQERLSIKQEGNPKESNGSRTDEKPGNQSQTPPQARHP